MIYESFEPRNFTKPSLLLIEQADKILNSYRCQGYTMTLRQLYYQFVARDILPNTERSYKNLGGLVTAGRMAGLLPWDGLEDNNRNLSSWPVSDDMQEIVEGLDSNYWQNMWQYQDTYVEVWVEKDALTNVIERATNRRRVPFLACKGYLSASEAWRAGRRFRRASDAGKRCVILHLGDHDPSGIDMTRDNDVRSNLFSYGDVEIRRLALNRDQIEEYNPPPNPAKLTDARARDYVAEHGRQSWELDALEPSVVVDLVRSEIDNYVDMDQWEMDEGEEGDAKAKLRLIGEHWAEVEDFLNTLE